MTRSWRGRKNGRRYERAGSVVLGQVRLAQAPISLRKSRWLSVGRWFLLACAAVAGVLALWLTLDARFYIYGAEIDGTRRVSRQEVFEVSGLMGLHILWARPVTIEAQILDELPSLESAEVSCSLPSDCSITVLERQPRVLWNDGEELWWIDEEAAIFPARNEADGIEAVSQTAGRWLVKGPLPRSNEGELDEHVRVALTELWTSGLTVPEEFDYTAEHGLSFVNERGWRVIIGQGAGVDERLRILELIAGHLESHGVVPRFVDVRFPAAPYYSPVDDS
ncbi:MAG: FtsQ-type POTRA domain-containing protein [Anaerolineae bacterium]